MRTFIILLTLFPFMALCQRETSDKLAAQGLKKYPIEKAIINYEITGDAEGEEVFLFDRFGWRSLKKRSMQFELYNEKRSQSQHEISDGKLIYRINHADSTYQERVDIRWSTLASRMSPLQASESVLFSLGGTYAADSTLNGRQCQVWTFQGRSLREMWVWQGIALKRKSVLGGLSIVTTATSVSTEEQIEDSRFSLPETYTLKK